MKQLIFFSIVLSFLSTTLFAQEQDSTINLRESALNIFIDCDYNCDINYIKNNVTMVNYVRDVKVAEVYIRVNSQATGSGGRAYTLVFEGQQKYEGQQNEIVYATEAVSTADERRKIMTKNMKAGLLPFIAQTPFFDNIDINFTEPDKDKETEELKDIWNNWIYQIGLNGWFNGQSNQSSLNFYGNISARKVTEKWKISFSASGDLNRDKYIIGYDVNENPEFFISETNGYGFYTYAIRAINDHWSVGASNDVSASSYSNIKLANDLSAAIEYNLYPYEEATKRQLRFSYQPGYRFNSYADTTIYDKTYEHLAQHRLKIAYETQSKWGSIDASISSRQYFHDLGLYSIRLYSGINVRIVKGLQLNLSGNVGLIRDQITLQKGGATEQDILTQQRELATSYSYWGNFGISYSFGSIYNNVVFPRFGGGL
ncbi:MAG: hypothetical protein ACI94Y_002745 [Maribacter sp.]|jgi:hypothetical protein